MNNVHLSAKIGGLGFQSQICLSLVLLNGESPTSRGWTGDRRRLLLARNTASRGPSKNKLSAPAKFATEIPSGISSAEAAPLLCGGITVYGALDNANMKVGQWIVILGAAGGLGHLGTK